MSIDWDAIRIDYITTGATYRQLQEKYGVNASTIRTRAYRAKWKNDREKAEAKAKQIETKKLANGMAKRTGEISSITDEYLKFLRRWLDNRDPETAEAQEVTAAANALRTITEVDRMITRTPTIAEETNLKRLQLDEKRYEAEQAEKQQTAGDKINWIIQVDDGEGDDLLG